MPEERNVSEITASGEPIARIPSNLAEALDALANDEVIQSALPGHLHTCYEWNQFCWQVSDRDVKKYLDCLP